MRPKSGFEVLPCVFTSYEVGNLAAALEDVDRSRAGARHLMAHPAVAGAAHDERLLAIARRWLGPDVHPYRATLSDKSPEANWLVVWHQDTALPLHRKVDVPGWGPWSEKAGVLYAHAPASALEAVVALRLHLDDSHADNGPLRVLPGSHERGVLSDEALRELAHDAQAEECLVGRGGIVVMKPLLVHASSKSSSPAPRKVLHIEYAKSLLQEGGLGLRVA
jgi:ectoine hydroxylase-related dioxygenase (phytanoyl-CoA dioxygenase family)